MGIYFFYTYNKIITIKTNTNIPESNNAYRLNRKIIYCKGSRIKGIEPLSIRR